MACGKGKNCKKRREGEEVRKFGRRIEALPRLAIGLRQLLFVARLMGKPAAKVFEQILESEEWLAYIGIGPVKKHAACLGHQDVSGIQVQMAERAVDVDLLTKR